MSAEKENRCWPGYEPVPGKKPNSQGSCRPKPDSRSTEGQKKFKAKRRQQLDTWEKKHPKSRPQAAQHLSGPNGESSSLRTATSKKAASKKAVQKRKARKAANSKSKARKQPSKAATSKAKKTNAPKSRPRASKAKKTASKRKAA